MMGRPFTVCQGTATAANKLKALSASSGLRMYSTFDSLSVMLDPMNCLAVSMYEDRDLINSTAGWAHVGDLE